MKKTSVIASISQSLRSITKFPHISLTDSTRMIKKLPDFINLKNPNQKPRELIEIWMFPKIVVPQNGWFIMENPIKMDDLGVPLFLETPISEHVDFLRILNFNALKC